MLNYKSDNILVISISNSYGFRRITDYSLMPLMFHKEKENGCLLNVRIQTIYLNMPRGIILQEENGVKPANSLFQNTRQMYIITPYQMLRSEIFCWGLKIFTIALKDPVFTSC